MKRFGVIGIGRWAVENHLPALQRHPRAEVVAVHDVDPTRYDAAGLDPAALRAGSVAELLTAGLDGVVIATPSDTHADLALETLTAGVHTLVEKPVAATPAEARTLIDAAAAGGAILMCPHGWNYWEPVLAAARAVAAGELGRIEMVQAHIASPMRTDFAGHAGLGRDDRLERVGVLDPRGFGYSQLSHVLAAVYAVCGQTATEVTSLAVGYAGHLDLACQLSLSFRSGAIGVVSGSAFPEGLDQQVLSIRVHGSRGHLHIESLDGRQWRSAGPVTRPGAASTAPSYDGRRPVDLFVDRVAGSTERDPAPPHLLAAVVATLDAANRAVAGGRPAAVDPI